MRRRDPGLASLHALLNAPPVLSLHDSGTGAVLASVPLDLTPLGLGHTSLTLNDLLLDLAPQPDAAGAATPGSAAAAKPAGASKPATPQQGAKKGADAGAAAADPTPVPTAKLAGRPLVPELTLRLTHREAPLADGAGASSPGGATPPVPGSKPPSKPATPTPTPPSAAAETAGDTLPEPLPYRCDGRVSPWDAMASPQRLARPASHSLCPAPPRAASCRRARVTRTPTC